MGHTRRRPIVGTTAAGQGATYIPVEACQNTNIQVIANNTPTFTVDWTLHKINYDATALAAHNLVNLDTELYKAPASATWNNAIASGTASAAVQLDEPIMGIRINITSTATAPTVSYVILQSD